jgi:hypothetical protein
MLIAADKTINILVKMKRPFSVTLLALAVLLFAIYQAWRAIAAMQQIDFMRSLGLETQAALLISIGAAWSIGFALASIGLWRLKGWGRRWMLIAVAAYTIEIWIERFTLERTSYEQLTRPVNAIVSVLIVLLVWGFLFLPKIRQAFKTE